MLHHIHLHLPALFVLEHGYGIVNLILSGRHYALHRGYALQLEGYHDFQGLMVLFNLTQPIALLNLVANFCQGLEVPQTFVVERLGVLSALEEHAFHLVEVVLQTVVVLTQHARTELNFQHVARELGFGAHFQSTGAFKHLYVHVLTYDLNYFGHQSVSASCDVAYLSLYHWSVHTEGDHVGDYATNFSFCHNI